MSCSSLAHLRTLIVLAGLACAGCHASHQVSVVQQPDPAGQAIPLTFVYDVPVAVARIGGQPLRLMIDLGGHDTITLRSAVVDRLGADVKRTGRRAFSSRADGALSFDQELLVSELSIGSITMHDVVGHEIDFHGPADLEAAVDGYVGAAILRQFLMLVDYPGQIVLYPADAPPPLDTGSWTPIAIDGRITSQVALNGRPSRIAWDTGAGRNVIDPTVAKRLCDPGQGTVAVNVRLGARDFPETEFFVKDVSGAQVDAILGYSFFAGHRVFFDFTRGQALIEAASVAAQP